MSVPSYREELISQIPALQVLMALGYQYLTPEEALTLRGGRRSQVVLNGILEPWLRDHNAVQTRGQSLPFTDSAIAEALRQITDIPYTSLVRASETAYELLTLGVSLEQTVGGDRKSYSLRYIDWAHPENNVYHVTDEFTVERSRTHETRRPDIVVFVNGIPLAVIECKRPDLATTDRPTDEAISQSLRNQRDDEIPGLFIYSQLLLAVDKNDARYATTGSAKEYWSAWKENDERGHETYTEGLVNPGTGASHPLSPADEAHLYDWREDAWWVRQEFARKGKRLPTVQDRTLASLLHPSRLLELAYQYIVYDGGVKKIARYQQYFAIRATLDRVAHLNAQGERAGGVIWHTTGSGKSLTMVMLAKALALQPTVTNPRVVIVTDRVNLDEQIWRTFNNCGKTVAKAGSGRELIELIRSNRADIITTVINKFETVAKESIKDDDANLFVLVDEGHRSQYGTIHAKMRQVFKKACYIGFTGTPLTHAEKSTARKFGDFIHKYTMRQAVEDRAVVPLLYEGRIVDLEVDKDAIDKWFERVTAGLNEDQRGDLKLKMSRNEEVSQADQRIKEIAYDIGAHFAVNFQGTGFKGMLATPSKAIALKYKRYMDEFRQVRTEVVISPPDTREGNEEVDNDIAPEAEAFWKKVMARFGTEEAFNREVLADFSRPDGVELLIVVDKLLVGFDEPRNRVLYIDKPLKEHGLLQAIARVNRVFPGKDDGLIIDYRGVLGELNAALETYNALEGYDPEDVAGMVSDVSTEIDRLPELHAALWEVFRPVVNPQDSEEIERFLEPEDRRQQFYEALSSFARGLRVALGSVSFYENTPQATINAYRRDMVFFHNLRMAVKHRYAEVIDYKDYEQKIRKLMDEHIKAEGAHPITELVDIFDGDAFAHEVGKLGTAAARADTIAYRLKRTISEKMELDPAFYLRFSKLIEDTIRAYEEGRISELEYLETVTDAMDQIREGHDRSQPVRLRGYRHASAYYGVIHDSLAQDESAYGDENQNEMIADVAIRLEETIEAHKVRDWSDNPDIQNDIRNQIDDSLYGLKDQHGIALDGARINLLVEQLLDVARKRDGL